MALITCEECLREISSRASSCPHCGCPAGKELQKLKTVETSIIDLPSDDELIRLREISDSRPINRSLRGFPQAQQTRVVVNNNGCGAGCGNGCLFIIIVTIVIFVITSLS